MDKTQTDAALLRFEGRLPYVLGAWLPTCRLAGRLGGLSWALASDDDDDEAGLYALVEQVRRIRALTTGGMFDTDLGPLTDRIRRVADELEAASASPEQRQEVNWRERRYASNCPIIGRSNVLAPPAEFELLDDGTLRAEMTLGLEYQGPRGVFTAVSWPCCSTRRWAGSTTTRGPPG